jgi:4-amino-4-deoxy-L-arabinose transferase-like glycosyltransferase
MRISTSSGILILIIVSMILGLILRLFLVVSQPIGGDSGLFLYWAKLINNGKIPYRDFFIRDPVYIYLVALSISTLGISFPVASLASVVPSVMTAPILYKVSREIFDQVTGLVSALIFSFAPTILWYGTVIDERSLMLFLSVLGMWALVKSLKANDTRFLFLFGLIIGVGTFAYRAIAIYAVTLPLFLAFFNRENGFSLRDGFRRLIFQTIVSWGSFLIAFGSIFLLFSATSSFNWMVSNFGFSGQQESAAWFIWARTSPPSFKDRVFFVAVREWFYLLVPASVFMIMILFRTLSNRRNLALGITSVGITAFLVATLTWRTAEPQASFGGYEPSDSYLYAFLAFLVVLPGIAAAAYRALYPPISRKETISIGWALIIFWFMSTAILMLLFGVPVVNYYYYFAPSMTLLASPAISSAIKQIRSTAHGSLPRIIRARAPILFLALLLANACVTAAMLYTTPMTWRNESVSSVYDIASYIHFNTTPQDEILAGDPSIALIAQRKPILGITELRLYGSRGPEPFVPVANDPFHLFPNVTEISQFMASGGVKYVVADQSPATLDVIGLHPLWKATFLTNFVLETWIDGVAIYRYSPTWDLSEHLDAVEAFSNSTVYSYTNQSFLDGFGHVLISSRNTSLHSVGGAILTDQVLFHPPFVSGNSYIQISIPRNKYTNLTTSFALADGAIGKSNGVTYSVQATEGSQQLFLFNQLVTTNSWQQSSTLLPTGPDLIIVLTSNSGASSSYDWLQITLTLKP